MTQEQRLLHWDMKLWHEEAARKYLKTRQMMPIHWIGYGQVNNIFHQNARRSFAALDTVIVMQEGSTKVVRQRRMLMYGSSKRSLHLAKENEQQSEVGICLHVF